MGRIISERLLPPDDPMFLKGPDRSASFRSSPPSEGKKAETDHAEPPASSAHPVEFIANDYDWDVIFQGSGSVTGNDWFEEVSYLGHEKWLLQLRDDPAFSLSTPLTNPPEAMNSAELVHWVIDMDRTDDPDCITGLRAEELLDLAKNYGAKKCVEILYAESKS